MSMEEILASIRRYVADDSTEQSSVEKTVVSPPPNGRDHLYGEQPAYDVYGHAIHHSSSEHVYEPVSEVIRLTEAYEAPSPYSITEKPIEPRKFRSSSSMSSAPDVLLSEQAKMSSTQAFSKLKETANNLTQPKESPIANPSTTASGVTLDHLIAEIARPMIKQWLDNNLPSLVESLVNKEIEKITREMRGR